MALTASPIYLQPVSPWSLSRYSAKTTEGAGLAVEKFIMSVESSSSMPSSKASESHKERRSKRQLSSGQSTESEGPVIVINDTASSESEEESIEIGPNEEVLTQRFRLVSVSEYESVPSSGNEFTSEGGDSELEKRPLTPASTLALTQFLEDVLSDDGLSQDLFLLKHVGRHRHGFVSLKLLAGYKQAKKLNYDWHALSTAAKQSTKLEVNADGRKVRRKTPLPDSLLHVPPSRVIAAVDVPESMMSMEGLATTFGKYGNLASLQLIRHKPGAGVSEELQSLVARVPEVSHTHCVLVHFENVWGVSRALKEFKSTQISLHVIQTHRRSSRSSLSSRNSNTPTNMLYRHSSPRQILNNKRNERLETEWRRRISKEYRTDSTGSEAEDFELNRRMNRVDARKPRASLPSLGPLKKFYLPPSLPNSPQVSRRCRTPGVLRIPKGPDGTKGFHNPKNVNSNN